MSVWDLPVTHSKSPFQNRSLADRMFAKTFEVGDRVISNGHGVVRKGFEGIVEDREWNGHEWMISVPAIKPTMIKASNLDIVERFYDFRYCWCQAFCGYLCLKHRFHNMSAEEMWNKAEECFEGHHREDPENVASELIS